MRRRPHSGAPIWTTNGRELVYLGSIGVMAVDVVLEGNALRLGKPQRLFELPFGTPSNAGTYDVAADGARFVVLLTTPQKVVAPPRTNVTLVFNFFEEIRRALAGKRP